MNGKKMFEAVGYVGSDLIEEALTARRRKPVGRYLALAACICLIAAGGLAIARSGLFQTGVYDGTSGADGSEMAGGGAAGGSDAEPAIPGDGTTGAGASGAGHAAGSTFDSYAGPVFPLTLAEENDAITAERTVTWDFSADTGRTDGSVCAVTDVYTLVNGAAEDQTVTLVYPFVSDLLGLEVPALTVDGETVTAQLRQGAYGGGFMGASADDLETGSWNLREPGSWEDYQVLLDDGSYQAQAFADDPVLEQSVIVYEVSDETMPADAGRAATIALSFTIDPEQTTVLSYNFNGYSWDESTGACVYSYFADEWDNDERPRLLVVLGADIGTYEIAGYSNGSCEADVLLPGSSAQVTRAETTLGELLRDLADAEAAMGGGYVYDDDVIPFTGEQLYRAAAEMLTEYGVLSDDLAQRYSDGRLDDLFTDAIGMDRVFYLTAEVTIPAGGSIVVSADMTKQASYDFACTGSENVGVWGYDLVTQLGSVLAFTGQAAVRVPCDGLEIVRQNFGFDPEEGVRNVTLDPAQEHYYLEVQLRGN